MSNKKTKFSDSFFSLKLYAQALKQLKTVGIVSLICTFIYVVLCPILSRISLSESDNLQLAYTGGYYAPLIAVVYIIVPIMCLVLFNFLTNRKGCDFYHSIPLKRRCIFLTFVSAIITWAFIITCSFTVLLSIMLSLISTNLVISMSSVLIYSLNIFISSIFIAAVFSLGCSISGTLFSNFATSVIILVVPRLLITTFCELIDQSSYLVNADNMPFIFRECCNMAVYPILPFRWLSYGFPDNVMPFSYLNFATVYTLMAAIIYIVIGCVAFVKRPSETAGKAYPNKIFGFISRMLIGYVISLIAVAVAYIQISDDSFYFSTMYIIIFAFAAIAMLIYEVIMTKSVKRGIKTFITAPLIIVFDAVTIGGLFLASGIMDGYSPDSDDVDYVYISDLFSEYLVYSADNSSICYEGDYYYESGYYYGYNLHGDNFYNFSQDYYNNKVADYKITSREIIEILVDSYNTYKENLENTDDDYYYDDGYYYRNDYNYNNHSITVTFDNGLFDTQRTVYVSEEDYVKIIAELNTYTGYKECLTQLPESTSDMALNCAGLTSEQTEAVYSAMLTDMEDWSLTDKVNLLTWQHTSHSSDYVGMITVDLYNEGTYSTFDIPISDYTPKAFALYLKYFNQNNEKELLDVLAKSENTEYDTYITINRGGLYNNYIYVSSYTADIDKFYERTGLSQMISDFVKDSDGEYDSFSTFDSSDYCLCRMEITVSDSEDVAYDEYYYKTVSFYFLMPRNSHVFDYFYYSY